ncbi:MAG: glycosyltransferase family 39 protein [bacterium]|nr:glycosyltransferase family 39 protein [bacterium]
MKRTYIMLVIIVVAAGLLRFFQITSTPASLTWDEAAWGYNAFSLLKTGQDEFGKPFPVTYLESFGDFKPPLYAYLSVIPVAVFGLNEFSTRFASAFFGTLTVLVTYFLVARVFFLSERKQWYGLFAALFLAFSPWHINLSRAAFEANVATFFLVGGVWLFLEGLGKNRWLLSISALSFALSFYTFNTSRVVAPLLVLILGVFFWRELLKKKKELFVAACIGVIVLLPLLPFLFSPQAQLRYKEVNIFSDSGPVVTSNQHIERNGNTFWSKILDNRRVFFAREYLRHYFDNLSPSFLFIKGDGNPKFSTQQVGEMYLFDLPFLVIGVFLLFRKREGYWYLLPLWFFLGILPAATARETPHALRIETVLPVPQILIAYGFVQCLLVIKKGKMIKMQLVRRAALFGVFLLFFVNVSYYLHDYYTNYKIMYSGEWQYGYKEAYQFTRSQEKSFDTIYVTTDLGRPYIYYLFFSELSPSVFQSTAKITRDVFGFVSVDKVGKYHFIRDFSKINQSAQHALFLDTPTNIPGNAKVLQTFYLLNKSPVLVAYTI